MTLKCSQTQNYFHWMALPTHPLLHIVHCSLSSHSFFCSTEEEWNHYYNNIETDLMRKPIHFCRLNRMSSEYLLRHICIIYSLDERTHTHTHSGVWLPPISAYSSGERHIHNQNSFLFFLPIIIIPFICRVFLHIVIEMHAERVNRIAEKKERIRRVHFGQLNRDQLHYCA